MRAPISKKLRFEILKRDKFSCRYCGASVPDAKLVVDHLIPVNAGGTDDYFNLVAACFDCNSGKSDRKLDDNSIERQQVQITEQFTAEVSRQSQIAEQYREAMHQQAINVRALRDMWLHKTEESLGRAWDPIIDKWLKVFGFGILADSIQIVALRRLGIQDVARYAAVILADEQRPGMKQCYLLRGQIMKKFSDFNWGPEARYQMLGLLTETTIEKNVAYSVVQNVIAHTDKLDELIVELAHLSDRPDSELPQSFANPSRGNAVFVREGTPEWDAWQRYKRRTTGKGTPMNSQFGWYFPSQFPPEAS